MTQPFGLMDSLFPFLIASLGLTSLVFVVLQTIKDCVFLDIKEIQVSVRLISF